MQNFDKLSLDFILNQGEKPQQENLPASIPCHPSDRPAFNFPDVEEEPVHTLLALKNYIVHQHHQQLQLLQQQPQPLASAEVDPPIRQDINTITTTRSSFYFVNTVEGLPLVLPKFRPQETSDDYLFHQHHQQQHQQHLQQQQQFFLPTASTTTAATLPPFGHPQPESFSPSGCKKRKLAERELDDSLNEEEDANPSSEEETLKPAKKQGGSSNNKDNKKKEKKKRVRPTREQAAFLDRYFQSNPHPDTPARLKIAQTINMSPKTVCTWFQNKRARERRALKKQKKNNSDNNNDNNMVFHSDFLQV